MQGHAILKKLLHFTRKCNLIYLLAFEYTDMMDNYSGGI
jgi:hypothetical protein